jgi:hypothetical protein
VEVEPEASSSENSFRFSGLGACPLLLWATVFMAVPVSRVVARN